MISDLGQDLTFARAQHVKLLLGDVERSYLWNKPDVRAIGWHNIRAKRYTLKEFLNILKSVDIY